MLNFETYCCIELYDFSSHFEIINCDVLIYDVLKKLYKFI